MTKKLNNKKGFTLAELLVVVAIIAVLVAVSIPIFSAQTKKANLATNQANARAAKAAAVTEVLGNGATGEQTFVYTIADGKSSSTSTTVVPTITKDPTAWTVNDNSELAAKVYQTWYVTVGSDGSVTGYRYDNAK